MCAASVVISWSAWMPEIFKFEVRIHFIRRSSARGLLFIRRRRHPDDLTLLVYIFTQTILGI